MADFVFFEHPPWCNGREYCNGPAASKIRCLVRPPPWWWWIEYTGFTGSFTDLNTVHLVPIWRVATGWNLFAQWRLQHEHHPSFETIVGWEPDAINPGQRRFFVHFQNTPSLTQHKLWGWINRGSVTSWFTDYDDVDPPLLFTSSLWGLGDVVCKLKIGTYDRIPAQSCRGDYGGEWP